MSLGKVINKYRTEHDMTMQTFADKAGVTKAYISMLEKGYASRGQVPIPTIEKYVSFANVMNISVDELLALSNDYVDIGQKSHSYNNSLLTDEETELVKAYREAPEAIQQSVCKLLDIPPAVLAESSSSTG